MTLAGTMNKTVLLFLLLIASAMVIWWMAFNGSNPLVPAIGMQGLVLVVIAAFKPQYSPYLAQDTRYLKACLLEESLPFLKLNILVL
jgi:uncharacterized YccA/Bax inhibitor family protein